MQTRDFTLEVDGLRILACLYLPALGGAYPTVVICHGIPSGIPTPGDKGYPFLAEQLCQQGFAVLIFNFRGTGESGGNLDILGWARDLRAVVGYLYDLPEADKSRLFLFGFSAGAAVSIYLAAHDKRISAVVACACPAEFSFVDSPESLVEHFRNIGVIRERNFPPSVEEWFSGFKLLNPISYVSQISPRPLLLIHGSEDELVPVSDARRLYERAGRPKKLVIIKGAGHRLRQDERAVSIAIGWLRQTSRLTVR